MKVQQISQMVYKEQFLFIYVFMLSEFNDRMSTVRHIACKYELIV
jgi:hypothetical protein